MADFAVVLIRADTELRATVAEKRSKEDGSLLRELSARRTAFSAESSEIVVSPTELADFDRCPRQYFFRHLQELLDRHQCFGAHGSYSIP